MKIDAAKDLLETIFASSYSRDNFKRLVAEVFNGYDRKEQTIYKEESVKSLTNLGLFEDGKGKKIAVFEVELLSDNSLHRARVKQRNLIANQLKINYYDCALCSFYNANQGEWRLSFITRETSIDEKLKFIEQLSPSRRQSFIAGPNEGTHTAKKQFLPRIQSDNKPSFDEIASIFAIEAVNDDFYEQYKELYLRLTEELKQFMEKDPVIAADFQEKEVSTSDFAKKTLGQFVFLYFLQRKGWIKDKAYPDEVFSFSKLFDERKKFGDNFFNDVMEPIFYESLAKKEPNLEVYSVLTHYEFPYLNGGLFEPIRDYDWEKTNIVIPDSFFKNDNSDGLLDVFNRFNFTVHENDALEQDIAVDPEMLGKVFENLLDIKDRKSKGAFYTPREIVQYMCQESLINYLVIEIGHEIPSEALKLFITNHSILEAEDMKGSELEVIVESAIDLDQLLANVKVCDPAVGSGAFPMGMLSEIVSARNSLQPFLYNKRTIYDLKLHTIGQSLYGVDLDPSAVDIARLRFWLSLIIEEDTPIPLPNLEHKLMQGNSLLSSYEGVELFNDQFLANEDNRQEKLTIIDEEVKVLEKELKDGVNTNDISIIKAIKKHLIRLGKQKIKIQAQHTTTPGTQQLFENDDALSKIRKKVDLLQSKIKEFLLLDENSNKGVLKNEIENIKWDLIESSIDSESKAKAFQQFKNKRIQPFFLWQLEFADLFGNKNGGFDIVIGNPPYVGEKGNKELFRGIKHSKFGDKYYSRKMDLFYFFFHLALDLTKSGGTVSFITSNYWLTADGAYKLRSDLKERANILKLLNFGELKLFSSAKGQHNIITLMSKCKSNKILETFFSNRQGEINPKVMNLILSGDDKNTIYSRIEQSKIYQGPKHNIHIKINETIDTSINDFFEKVDLNSTPLVNYAQNVFMGVQTGADILKKDLIKAALEKQTISQSEANNWDLGTGVYVLSHSELEMLKLSTIEKKDCIKPFYKNSHISRYVTNSEAKNSLIYVDSSTNIESYPNIKKHLNKFKPLLAAREQAGKDAHNWFWIRGSKRDKFFYREDLIVVPYRSKSSRFSICNQDIFGSGDLYYISLQKPYSNKALLGYLNSSFVFFHLENRGKRKGKIIEYYKTPLEQIPIHKEILENPSIVKKIEIIVENIINEKNLDINADTLLLEQKLDLMIFKIYNLLFNEVRMIDPNFSISEAEYNSFKI